MKLTRRHARYRAGQVVAFILITPAAVIGLLLAAYVAGIKVIVNAVSGQQRII